MTADVTGFSVIGALKWRRRESGIADLWQVRCADEAEGHYVSPHPRLFVALQARGDGAFAIDAGDGYRPHAGECAMSYIPAGWPVHARAHDLTLLSHLDLHFDASVLKRRFGAALDAVALGTPRIAFHDDGVAMLARLLEAECASEVQAHELYGDGLLTSLFARLMRIETANRSGRNALSRGQLRTVMDYIEANCLRTVRLAELAALTQMSESTLSHAFKASTGMPPLRWHMHARIRRVQAMLSPGVSLTSVAAAAGFADQAHLTRAFKAAVGTTPAAWVRTFCNSDGKPS